MNIITIRQSIRNLRRNRIYSFINLAGLSISGAFIILVVLYVKHALQMDKYSTKTDNIYRIEMTQFSYEKKKEEPKKGFFDWLAKGSEKKNTLATPVILAGDLQKSLPEIEATTRLKRLYEPVLKFGTRSFRENGDGVAYVDKNFFSFFDLPLVYGNPTTAFSNKNSAVISQRAAKKYFGDLDPIGKTFSISSEDNQLFTISAVAKNFPANSSMQFDVMVLVEGSIYYEGQVEQGTNTMSYLTLLSLKPGTDRKLFEQKLDRFGAKYFAGHIESYKKFSPEGQSTEFSLFVRPFAEAHYNASTPWFYFTDLKSLYQLIVLALIALGIACLNYVLLSLSRVAARSHEAGIHKTIGARWKHIMAMVLTETCVLVSIAVLLGFVLAVIALPYFNELANVKISQAEILSWDFLLVAIGLIVLLSLVAGIYPAIKMAGISPLNMLRKFGTYKLSPSLSRLFIGVQYTACIVLIVLAIVIARQIDYVYNKDMGFDKEQVLIVNNPYWGDKLKTLALREKLQQYASSKPALIGFTASTFRFGGGLNRNGHIINGERQLISEMTVDYDYFEFNKIQIVHGRPFSPQFLNDTSRLDIPREKLDSLSTQKRSNLVVNATLYGILGNPPLNELNRPLGGIIVGVCKDYFIEGLQQKIAPVYHLCRPQILGYFSFRIGKGENIASVLGSFQTEWKKFSEDPFTYSFMDEDVKLVYESNARWMKIISAASWMAIFIASLGLFGLSAVTAVNRTKEIGIRKVLGARILQLFYTLNRQIAIIVLVAVVIAMPIAVYIADSWLQDFAYRIQLKWSIFALAAIIGVLCAIIAVSYHTLKAATGNPVKALRNE